jgi:hypothetical protein
MNHRDRMLGAITQEEVPLSLEGCRFLTASALRQIASAPVDEACWVPTSNGTQRVHPTAGPRDRGCSFVRWTASDPARGW